MYQGIPKIPFWWRSTGKLPEISGSLKASPTPQFESFPAEMRVQPFIIIVIMTLIMMIVLPFLNSVIKKTNDLLPLKICQTVTVACPCDRIWRQEVFSGNSLQKAEGPGY